MSAPLAREPLPLPVDPRSVRTARKWVSEVLEKLGREDLVDSAALGVSELVTNALLHADPPITVSVRGTRDHPRVEVSDTSQAPPELEPGLAEDEHLMSTIGRGLGIVALYSTTWGSHVAPEGKTVWFEPSTEIEVDGDLSGEVFDLAELVGDVTTAAAGGLEGAITIRLLNMPAQVFAFFRQRYRELRRELSLLALAHGADYPVATDLAELSVQIEQERQQARGVDQLDVAIERGDLSVDLEYLVPRTAPDSMMQLYAMLERADEFCRQERLLALAATPQQKELLDWYLNEFRRQADGEEPIPWSGSLTLDTERPRDVG